jgi:hypothetical protein
VSGAPIVRSEQYDDTFRGADADPADAVRQSGHRGIENTVRQPAFDDLVTRIENGTQPAGDDVLGDGIRRIRSDRSVLRL